MRAWLRLAKVWCSNGVGMRAWLRLAKVWCSICDNVPSFTRPALYGQFNALTSVNWQKLTWLPNIYTDMRLLTHLDHFHQFSFAQNNYVTQILLHCEAKKCTLLIFAITCQTALYFDNFWRRPTSAFTTKLQHVSPSILMGVSTLPCEIYCHSVNKKSLLITTAYQRRLTSLAVSDKRTDCQ